MFGRTATSLNDGHSKRGGAKKKTEIEDEMHRMWEGKRGGRKLGQKRDVKKTASQERSERRAGRNIKKQYNVEGFIASRSAPYPVLQ